MKDAEITTISSEHIQIDLIGLDSFLVDLEVYAERAECLQQDVTENYFNPGNKPNATVCFDEYRIKSEIAAENLLRLRQWGEEARKRLDRCIAK